MRQITAIDFNNIKMQYPLPERIGNPDLFTGRREEFTIYHRWLNEIPKMRSRSKVIFARGKAGKTAFIQRIFNQLWSANGNVIPFYYEIKGKSMWLGDLAEEYYRTFASHYISFLERKPEIVRNPLPLNEIKEYGAKNSIKAFVSDTTSLHKCKAENRSDMMWSIAYKAPHEYGAMHKKFFLVILDEFQNINGYIYHDKECKSALAETTMGSFHEHSQSKIAPMLCAGSEVRCLLSNIEKYLGDGHLKRMPLKTYLTQEEGLEAVYKYAEMYNVPITDEAAFIINRLCHSDIFFISCIICSTYQQKDLTTPKGVIDTINYELTDKDAEFGNDWEAYLKKRFGRMNEVITKKILLHLAKHRDRAWTPQGLKDTLNLDMDADVIHEKLEMLRQSDLIDHLSGIDYIGPDDGTFYMVLRHRFEKEITGLKPDFKTDFHEEIKKLKRENRSRCSKGEFL